MNVTTAGEQGKVSYDELVKEFHRIKSSAPKPERPSDDVWINASAMWDAFVPDWDDDWSGYDTPIGLLLQWIVDEAEEYGIHIPQFEETDNEKNNG